MKTDLLPALAEAVTAAQSAKFLPEHQKIKTVSRFYELRGLHARGRIGDCALVTAHENAKKAASPQS